MRQVKHIYGLERDLLLSLFFMLPFSSTFASPILFNGFYAGTTVGGSFLTAKETLESTNKIEFPDGPSHGNYSTYSTSNINAKSGHNAVIGALYAGLGATWKSIYLGAEIFGNYSNYQMNYAEQLYKSSSKRHSTSSYNLSADWQNSPKLNPFQYGIDLRPGFFIKPNLLLYTRFGYAKAQITQTNNTQETVEYYDSASSKESFSTSTHHQTSGFRVGGGFEYLINEDWSLRLDYIYTEYGSLYSNESAVTNIRSNSSYGNGTLTSNNITNLHALSTNAINIGISYYFTAYSKEYGF